MELKYTFKYYNSEELKKYLLNLSEQTITLIANLKNELKSLDKLTDIQSKEAKEQLIYKIELNNALTKLIFEKLELVNEGKLEKGTVNFYKELRQQARYKKIRVIRYYNDDKLPVIESKTLIKIQKNDDKTKFLTEKVEVLIKNEDEKSVRKAIKIYTKIEKLKIAKIRLNQRLEKISNKTLEKLPLDIVIKEAFEAIPYKNQKIMWGVIFTTPWLIGMAIFFIPSVIDSIWWSFNTVSPSTNGLEMKFVGLQNYIDLFTKYVIDGNVVFSVQLYMFLQDLLIDLPVIIIFSILIAVLLNKKFKGHKIIKAIFFIPVIFNFALISETLTKGFGQYIDSATNVDQMFVTQLTNFFLEIGLGNSLMEIVLQAVDRIFTIVNLSGIQILIFIAAIQAIPNQLYEAAKMEGASKYEIFWKITISMITPMILTAAIFTVVDSFTRAPIYRFLDYAMVQNRYGLAASISISYFGINILIVGLVFLLMKGKVFYYDDRK